MIGVRTPRLIQAAALLFACAVLAACGPTPPQAPLDQAKKLDESTGGISTACGLSYQVTAFPGRHQPDLTVLEATAISDAHKLASVYARNPQWIYQGDTITGLVRDSLTMLQQCGLGQAAATLSHDTHVQ